VSSKCGSRHEVVTPIVSLSDTIFRMTIKITALCFSGWADRHTDKNSCGDELRLSSDWSRSNGRLNSRTRYDVKPTTTFLFYCPWTNLRFISRLWHFSWNWAACVKAHSSVKVVVSCNFYQLCVVSEDSVVSSSRKQRCLLIFRVHASRRQFYAASALTIRN